ncbi:hypothetical protein BGX21_005637, partial [Mortierella sp. AD011]
MAPEAVVIPMDLLPERGPQATTKLDTEPKYEILELDWHRSSFSTRASRFQLQDMATTSVHTRNMAWDSNRIPAQRRAATAPFSLSTQITPAYLTRIFSLMTNLTSVELHVDACKTISAFNNSRRSKKLELDLFSCTTPGFSTRLFAGVSSRIGCLKLVMPPETTMISMDDLPVTGPWEITELNIEPEAIPLSAICPELRELTAGCDRDFVRQVPMKPVMAYSKLEILKLDLSFSSLSDHVKVCTSITSLKRFEIVVEFPNQVEFPQTGQSTVYPPLPSLQEIITKNTRGRDYTNNLRFLEDILFYPKDKRKPQGVFCVEGCAVNHLVVCGVAPHGWVCNNLQELRLNLLWLESGVGSAEEMNRRWIKVYRQIGDLEHLKTLSVESVHLGYYPGTGSLQE